MKYLFLLVLLVGCSDDVPKDTKNIDTDYMVSCRVIYDYWLNQADKEKQKCIERTEQQAKVYDAMIKKLTKKERESGLLTVRPDPYWCKHIAEDKTGFIYRDCMDYFAWRAR